VSKHFKTNYFDHRLRFSPSNLLCFLATPVFIGSAVLLKKMLKAFRHDINWLDAPLRLPPKTGIRERPETEKGIRESHFGLC